MQTHRVHLVRHLRCPPRHGVSPRLGSRRLSTVSLLHPLLHRSRHLHEPTSLGTLIRKAMICHTNTWDEMSVPGPCAIPRQGHRHSPMPMRSTALIAYTRVIRVVNVFSRPARSADSAAAVRAGFGDATTKTVPSWMVTASSTGKLSLAVSASQAARAGVPPIVTTWSVCGTEGAGVRRRPGWSFVRRSPDSAVPAPGSPVPRRRRVLGRGQ
jgi:hypothetical protein